MKESEFGKGFAYCIGLFLMHTERIEETLKAYEGIDVKDGHAVSMWFNGAADHLYELQIPENFVLKKACEKWRRKCLVYRLCMNGEKCGKEEYNWAIRKAKEFLRAWDRQNGIETVKGDWE